MSALHGDIEEGVLANLLQYLALSQATGRLSLRHPHRPRGEVYLEGGRVVYVDADPRYDVAALSELMSWQRGHFSFRPGVDAPRRTLSDSTERLLLEASHRRDTDSAGRNLRLDPASVLTTHVSPDDGRALVSLPALHVWRALDGLRDLGEIAEATGLPLHIVCGGGAELLQRGLARPAGQVLVDPAFVTELTREAVDILGPVAEVIVEDALVDVGVQGGPVSLPMLEELIDAVAGQLKRREWRSDFLERVQRLRIDYGLSA